MLERQAKKRAVYVVHAAQNGPNRERNSVPVGRAEGHLTLPDLAILAPAPSLATGGAESRAPRSLPTAQILFRALTGCKAVPQAKRWPGQSRVPCPPADPVDPVIPSGSAFLDEHEHEKEDEGP